MLNTQTSEHFDLCLHAEFGVSAMVVREMGDAMTTTRWFAQQIIFHMNIGGLTIQPVDI